VPRGALTDWPFFPGCGILRLMGIRINKVLGYGLADLRLDQDGEIDDPRVDIDVEDLYSRSMSDYLAFIEAKYANREAGTIPAFTDLPLSRQMVKYHPELLEENADDYVTIVDGGDMAAYQGHGVLVLRPWYSPDWIRGENALDHAEHAYRMRHQDSSDWTATEVMPLTFSPWPYNNMWVDAQDGRSLNETYATYLLELQRQDATSDVEESIAVIAGELGYTSGEEAYQRMVPAVPPNVQDLAEWLGIFPDPKTVHSLRPMVVQYWA